MIKKVPVSQLCIGMYVHDLGASFLDHAFWRSRFLIHNERKLRRLRESKLEWVLIDTSRGVDLPTGGTGAVAAPAPQAAPSVAAPATKAVDDAAPPPATTEQQAFDDAKDIIDGSREQVQQLFVEADLAGKIDLRQIEGLVQDMADSIEGHPDALTSLARIKRADQYLYAHSVAVSALMTALARTLGLSDEQVHLAGMAGLLHDIGKVRDPDEAPGKLGRPVQLAQELQRKHPQSGAEVLRQDPSVPPEVIDVCLHHHERIDGTGFPDGLAGEQISLLARMAAVCNYYDDVTSTRPFKKGWDPAFALFKMLQSSGQFDMDVLGAFVRTVGRYPLGSIISLTNSELGLVVAQNPGMPELPVVKIFYSIRWSHAIPERRVNLADPDCPSRVLPVVAPVDWAQSGLPVPPII
ncbi:MAG: HD-GYP domain-containing protein [Castellaniella sp.]|uniref:HD-GYP domain-containing protein n=1 Tax=Castellaniella sp. TaxID=1955812 RepID=UPI002A35AF7D|nr:HD-GYP domain-containing protein [Castellaniella sp.]MDY0308288.1 HD-GYP domain-containing protein [Castellaniella sp.]